MKLIVLALTLLSLHAQANDIQDYTEIQAMDLRDKNMIQVRNLTQSLIDTHHLSHNPYACSEVITFRGPTDRRSAQNLHLWTVGLANEMATIKMAEDFKLAPYVLDFKIINEKIRLLADRNSDDVDAEGVNTLATAMFKETQTNTKDYYFFSGDYLDTKMGWTTAVVLIKLSVGEAILIGSSNDCQ